MNSGQYARSHDSPAEFERLWRAAYSYLRPGDKPVPAPSIDFGKDMVIVASLGFQGGPGNGISVGDIRDHDNVLEIAINVRLQIDRCAMTAPTEAVQPTVMIKVPTSRSTPVLHDRIVKATC